MGILEEVNDKLDQVLALLSAGAAAPAAAPAKETKPKAAPKDKPAKPDFTAEQLRDKYLAVMEKHGDAAAKELIAEQGFDKLAKLVADTASWQKSWDAAEAKLAEDAADEDDNGGL